MVHSMVHRGGRRRSFTLVSAVAAPPLLLVLLLFVGDCSGEKLNSVGDASLVSTMQHWDHNYSCIFETGRSFTYLHIAYVTYFNITYKAPTYCSVQQCLDSCTSDCSCSAIVYDAPTTSCYQYHDYIPVQTIPFIPVRGRDTITAYIKVQHGYTYSSSSSTTSVSWLLSLWPSVLPVLFSL